MATSTVATSSGTVATSSSDDVFPAILATSSGLLGLTGLLIVVVYCIPGIVATLRHKRDLIAIWMLNLFLGWTFVGWVIALVWAFTQDTEKENVTPPS